MFDKDKEKSANIKVRFNILSLMVYMVSGILIAQLFNLQIVQGEEFRYQSNTRLTRETTLVASRGNIRFRSGDIAVGSSSGFVLEMYKTQIEEQELNQGILNIVTLLEQFEVQYIDLFPIDFDTITFKKTEQALVDWKEKYDIPEDATVEDAIKIFMKKYDIREEDSNSVRRIIAIRYAISEEGYSSIRPIEIASDIPREVVAQLNEMNEKFPGINIVIQSQRSYPQGNIASHILGYVGAINQTEYEKNPEIYKQTDLVGKTGIEYTFEEFLKGTDGIKQVDMDIDGSITNEYIYEEAIAGSDVILTLDSNLQRVTEDALKANIQKIASGGFGEVYDAKSGAAVVMDVKTGEILAMASYPDYDLTHFVGGISTANWNMYTNDEAKPLINKAIQSSYAPRIDI